MKANNKQKSRVALEAIVFVCSLVALVGCEDNNNVVRVVDEPPPAPQGVTTVRGNNSTTVYWLPVEADDLDYYRVYRGLDSTDGAVFSFIGQTGVEQFTDLSVSNGQRYFYTVTAVDLGGNESRQSLEYGGASPRVDGFNKTLIVNDVQLSSAGFNFATGSVVSGSSPLADIWLDRDNAGVKYINADSIAPVGDIQDMGYTSSLDEIGHAPTSGWSQLGYCEVIVGHTYVLWTGALRYAKVRVTSMTAQTVTFDYAYQAAESQAGGDGEPELVVGRPEIIHDAVNEKAKAVKAPIQGTTISTGANQ